MTQGSRRRRLWQLPTAAHELLLGLSLPPALLRATVAQTIGRQHAARCKLAGAEVDVLFSTVHDMAQRNVLSEALHKLLDTRHALAVQQLSRLRDAAALRQVWSQALADQPGPAVAALLWALLTHPLGAELQDDVLYAVRCWMYGRLRADMALADQTAALRRDGEQLRNALDDARAAKERVHAEATARAAADAQALASLRGDLARALAAQAPAPAVTAAAREREPQAIQAPREHSSLAPVDALPAQLQTPEPPPAASTRPVQIDGRKVLCVGGIHSAVHRYRALVEARGGRFLHHDGGIEHSLQRLQSQLDTADLVLCQAACVNHEAYHCVKAHCKRAGTACIYLDRPSLSRFARELGAAA